MSNAPILGGIELGGTKAVAVVGRDGQIFDCLQIPTGEPAATLPALVDWLRARGPLALGIAAFGPVRIAHGARDHGRILQTPKRGWAGTDLLEHVRPLGLPVAIDTDVGGAALAEYRWGAGQGASIVTYVTIGTGVGAGTLVEGKSIKGRLHPEVGHLLLKRSPGDGFGGNCRFHGDCVEGLLSGPALEARFGEPPSRVPAGDPRWSAPAADLATFLAGLLHVYAPERLLVGGGVAMGAPWLLDHAIERLPAVLAGYYPDLDPAALRNLISTPALGNEAGPLGALALAEVALQQPGP